MKRNDEVLAAHAKRMYTFLPARYLTTLPRALPSSLECVADRPGRIIDAAVATLEFLMESDLDDAPATLTDVVCFVGSIKDAYGLQEADDEELASYIMITIIQNNGNPRIDKVYDHAAGDHVKMATRFVDERDGVYKLTDQAYAMLFRSSEIDAGLAETFAVETFALRLRIENGNFDGAVAKSAEILRKAKVKRKEVDNLRAAMRVRPKGLSEQDIAVLRNEADELEDNGLKMLRELLGLVDEKRGDQLRLRTESVQVTQTQIERESSLASVSANIDLSIGALILLNKGIRLLIDEYIGLFSRRIRFEAPKTFRIEAVVERALKADKDGMRKILEKAFEFFIPLRRPLPFSVEELFANQRGPAKATKGGALELIVEQGDPLRNAKGEVRAAQEMAILDLIANGVERGETELSRIVESASDEELSLYMEENGLPRLAGMLWMSSGRRSQRLGFTVIADRSRHCVDMRADCEDGVRTARLDGLTIKKG